MASLNARELVVVNLEGIVVGVTEPTVPVPDAVVDATNMLPSSDFSDVLNAPVMPFILRMLGVSGHETRRVLSKSYVNVAEKASAGYAVLFASFKSRDWKRIKLSARSN